MVCGPYYLRVWVHPSQKRYKTDPKMISKFTENIYSLLTNFLESEFEEKTPKDLRDLLILLKAHAKAIKQFRLKGYRGFPEVLQILDYFSQTYLEQAFREEQDQNTSHALTACSSIIHYCAKILARAIRNSDPKTLQLFISRGGIDAVVRALDSVYRKVVHETQSREDLKSHCELSPTYDDLKSLNLFVRCLTVIGSQKRAEIAALTDESKLRLLMSLQQLVSIPLTLFSSFKAQCRDEVEKRAKEKSKREIKMKQARELKEESKEILNITEESKAGDEKQVSRPADTKKRSEEQKVEESKEAISKPEPKKEQTIGTEKEQPPIENMKDDANEPSPFYDVSNIAARHVFLLLSNPITEVTERIICQRQIVSFSQSLLEFFKVLSCDFQLAVFVVQAGIAWRCLEIIGYYSSLTECGNQSLDENLKKINQAAIAAGSVIRNLLIHTEQETDLASKNIDLDEVSSNKKHQEGKLEMIHPSSEDDKQIVDKFKSDLKVLLGVRLVEQLLINANEPRFELEQADIAAIEGFLKMFVSYVYEPQTIWNEEVRNELQSLLRKQISSINSNNGEK